MNDKQTKKKDVSRIGFLKSEATAAAAGGLITALSPINKATPERNKISIYFKELPVNPHKMADDVSQLYLASNWPDNPYTNTQIELMSNDRPEELWEQAFRDSRVILRCFIGLH